MTTVESASTPGLQRPPFAYKAFFSYSHAADGHLAAFLQDALQGAIAPDASRIATAGNNVVRLWQLSPEGSQSDAERATVARALAAREIDTTGAIAPPDRNAMLQVWLSLKQIADTHR